MLYTEDSNQFYIEGSIRSENALDNTATSVEVDFYY